MRTKVNKSKAIRKYLAENPGARPKDVVDAMKAKRIRVSPQQVSMVKSKMASPKTSGNVRMDQLVAAKVFVQKVGSIGEARQAVTALAKLM